MLINDPETLASVTAAFEAYEHALMTNDIDALDALFWPSEFTVRIGPGQNLYGIAAIQAFRTARVGGSPPRSLLKTVITSRSEEHTSELQSLMRISYAVFCLKKKTTISEHQTTNTNAQILHITYLFQNSYDTNCIV